MKYNLNMNLWKEKLSLLTNHSTSNMESASQTTIVLTTLLNLTQKTLRKSLRKTIDLSKTLRSYLITQKVPVVIYKEFPKLTERQYKESHTSLISNSKLLRTVMNSRFSSYARNMNRSFKNKVMNSQSQGLGSLK